ncbi:hypothetical protein [Salinivibrio kushneri]|uniref:hypothetical protein n=1 Tax=Salinivibrio kushneri TaxID=1908198 RepID=UPI0022B581AE|nr:hypothetical protein [Salinivibrio kushneri]WBA12870.1 hypothetical protein O4546_06630 [Salinivibrio kushneri]
MELMTREEFQYDNQEYVNSVLEYLNSIIIKQVNEHGAYSGDRMNLGDISRGQANMVAEVIMGFYTSKGWSCTASINEDTSGELSLSVRIQ